MKRTLFVLFLLLSCFTMTFAEEVEVWNGNEAISWNPEVAPGSQLETPEGIFSNLSAGDIVRAYTTTTYEAPQYVVTYKAGDEWTWTDLEISVSEGVLSFTVADETMATEISQRGLIFRGQCYNLVKITIEKTGGSEPLPVTYPIEIWTGEQVIDWSSNPSTWQTIGKDKFANVKAGDILRIQYKDVKAGAMMGLQYSVPDNWALLPGVEIMNVDGLATRITLTQDMLDAISSGDLHITGVGFTLTKVEALDASTIKTLTCNVPVTGDDWIWNNGETPELKVNIENNNEEAVNATATLLLATDKREEIKTLESSKEIGGGSNDVISFTLNEPLTPGFYRATIIVNDETVRAFNFGYAPTEISSPSDKQEDFESFWQTAKNELATIEADDEPVLTKIDSKSTEKRTVYLVEFKSVSDGDGQPVTVRGYYAEPNDGKKHPVIMHYQGYDSNYRPGGQDATPWCFDGDGDDLSGNYAEFILSTRGQSVNNRPASDRADGITRDFSNDYGDWFAYNFGDKDKYYYRGAYMDCVRAIDFMATRPTSDMTNLYAEGQSQGGAFTYAAAALSGREFKAIAPGIAFMGDFPDYFELANWPAEVARANQGTMTDDEMFAFLSYFDTKNLATLISDKTAVIATIGVQDNVCPPHTNIAPYNNLPEGTVKEISFNPENAHQVADNWYNVYMNYFASKYVEPQPETETVEPLDEGETRTLFENAEGVEMSWNEICEKSAEWGAILEEGEEILVTVSGKKAEAEWPKVILRDANSEQVLDAFVNEVTEFPHVVKFTLDAPAVEQLKNGFRISGDGVTITKVELSKPQKPTPQPAETVFDENGVADLSKIEAQGDKVTYDPQTHTVTTTEGWTGVQLTVTDGEEVSGKELRITFDRDIAVKCYVKYTDETDADIISKSEQVLYFDLDETKNVYQIQIQPTEAATFVINEIVVNKESTKPVLKPLEEGETRTLFEDAEGVVMAWNEICQKEEDWGAILESGEVFYVTIKERTPGSEWPKVILRNSNSEEVSAVELGDVENYPYIVKIKLTDDIVEQLRSGFRFSGDGITITKIEISKPAAAREGDVSIEAMNWFRNGVYDAETRTATTTARWGQTGWSVGDTRYDGMTLVIVNIEPTDFPVTLKMEYDNTDGIALATSTGIAAGKTQINLPLPLDTKVIKKIYLTWAEPGEVTLTDASLIAAANARPQTGYSDETDGILSIENSELRMENSYNLAGQRVGDAYKGMIIKNGKKFMVK